MIRHLLSALLFGLASSVTAQITITGADFGQAGDSIVVGYDNGAPANLSVGGTGMQTWDFSSLSVATINTLKFEFPANTASGALFPNADLAIERQDDTTFYIVNANEFAIDGFTGDPLNAGVNLALNFTPDIKQLDLPANLNDNFTTVTLIDSTVSCAIDPALQNLGCDSARIKRKVSTSSVINAYGDVETPGGTYTSVRQYLEQQSFDTVWALITTPFPVGWIQAITQDTTEYRYLWYANGEDWPVLSVNADGPNGDVVEAEFKVDETLISYVSNQQNPLCPGDCDGSAVVNGLGGVPPYTYQWPASAGGGTGELATNLCAGTYDVTVTDANSQTTIESVSIEDPEPFAVSASILQVINGGDGAIDLNASGGSGTLDFAWTGPNGFTASTEDLDSIEVGSYTVIISDQNGCDTSATFTVDLNGIGGAQSDEFAVFPNPAKESFKILTAEIMESVKVFDMLGNMVHGEDNPKEQSLSINTLDWGSGMYFVEVKTASGFYIRKLTIE